MHDLRCSKVSFQVDIFSPTSKDLVIFILVVQIGRYKLDFCLKLCNEFCPNFRYGS